MKKIVLGVGICVALASLIGTSFVGLAGNSDVTIVVYSEWSGEEAEAFEEVLSAFTELTGTKVKHVPQSEEGFMINLPLKFRAKKSPADVCLVPWPAWIRDLTRTGYLSEVTNLLNESEFSPLHLDEVRVDGTLYGVPYKMAGKPGFWYKVSFFDEHGLTPPATYDEFKELLVKLEGIPGIDAPIASGNGVGWPLTDVTEAFIIGLGGPELQEKLIAGEISWKSPEVREVFEELADLLKAGYFSSPSEWTAQVARLWKGMYGIYFMGDFIANFIDEEERDDLGFFPFPGTKGATGSIDYAFIPKYTKHPQEAEELVKFLSSPDAQMIWAKRGGYLAPNIVVPLDIYPPIGRAVSQFLSEVRVIPDLDDAIGGDFQATFWGQLILFWMKPGRIDEVLDTLEWSAQEA